MTSLTFRQKVIRHSLSAAVTFAFLAIGYVAIRQFLDRQWLAAFVAACVSLMLIPLVDHSSSIRERLFASCLMPFAMGGLATFVLVYFQMFQISWFKQIFNGKGSGPAGLISFALAGLMTGGYVGWRILPSGSPRGGQPS